MKLDVLSLPAEGRSFEGEETEGALDLQGEEFVRGHGPLHYAIRAQALPGELLVTGRLWAMVDFCCSRCAEFFPLRVEEPAFLYHMPLPVPGDVVDLTPEMREAILLAFPAYPVCREGCAGLCPHCGANRNEKPCSCAPGTEPRWGGLDNLKLE
jgi:uncharacterized protein